MAFSITLVFIVFVMQAYTIPTGSMADTLKGAHFRLRCQQCGYAYEYGFNPRQYNAKGYRIPENFAPPVNMELIPNPQRCCSCGAYLRADYKLPVIKGDRIFVLKCIYQFNEPKRWDVVVFKNPGEPKINYIKRLIGLPGETVELIDGDVFVDGEIARKPENVQEELWMTVYQNDYQPVNPGIKEFKGNSWKQPFSDFSDGRWNLDGDGGRRFVLDGKQGKVDELVYDSTLGNDFRATYAYDTVVGYKYMPVCSDLMVKFYVNRSDDESAVGAGLSKYGIQYRGTIDDGGDMVIELVGSGGEMLELARKPVGWTDDQAMKEFRFANVDHELILDFGDDQLKHDLGRAFNAAGNQVTKKPDVTIFGSGKVELLHVAIMRDIHYTTVEEAGHSILRGNSPFKLEEDQFFVCGDNSPASSDSRFWSEPGKGNQGQEYRKGIVPREYMIGKAFFIYWPGGFKPGYEKGLRLVPHIGGMKVIVGGDS